MMNLFIAITQLVAHKTLIDGLDYCDVLSAAFINSHSDSIYSLAEDPLVRK